MFTVGCRDSSRLMANNSLETHLFTGEIITVYYAIMEKHAIAQCTEYWVMCTCDNIGCSCYPNREKILLPIHPIPAVGDYFQIVQQFLPNYNFRVYFDCESCGAEWTCLGLPNYPSDD